MFLRSRQPSYLFSLRRNVIGISPPLFTGQSLSSPYDQPPPFFFLLLLFPPNSMIIIFLSFLFVHRIEIHPVNSILALKISFPENLPRTRHLSKNLSPETRRTFLDPVLDPRPTPNPAMILRASLALTHPKDAVQAPSPGGGRRRGVWVGSGL